MRPQTIKIAAIALGILGAAQMAGHMLNVPARLAMSRGGLRGTPKSDEELPKLNGLPIKKAIRQLFMDYKPH